MRAVRVLAAQKGLAMLCVLLAMPLSGIAGPKSYPMLCKAGGSARLTLGTLAQPVLRMNYTFRKGSRPATAGLSGGECTWMDRGISADEPGMMTIDTRGVQLNVDIMAGAGQSINVRVGGDPQKSATLNRLIQAVRSGREFQVYAYNDKQGHFVITRIGP